MSATPSSPSTPTAPSTRATPTARASAPFRLPAPRNSHVDLLVIAGEHSGDQHAARMVRELLAREGGGRLSICALGGPELAGAGAQLLHDMTATSVIGLVEVLKNFSFFRALFGEVLRWVSVYKPRAVCFVDYPGMNLRLAKAMRQRALSAKGGGPVRTLFYISPQIWAWKAARRFEMARNLDAMAVIFPFEPACYDDTALRGKVEFVGHPFVAGGYTAPVAHDASGPLLLLPGSRKQAVARIFPLMLAGYERYAAQVSAAANGVRNARPRPAVVLYPGDAVLSVLRAHRLPPGVTLRPATGAPVAASAVLTSSGTMSMHCALAGIPGAVVYRMNPVSYLLGRLLVKVPYIGIANLLLKEPMYPELIQNAAAPGALAAQLCDCLANPARLARTVDNAARLREILRQPSTGTAADWLSRQLSQ